MEEIPVERITNFQMSINRIDDYTTQLDNIILETGNLGRLQQEQDLARSTISGANLNLESQIETLQALRSESSSLVNLLRALYDNTGLVHNNLNSEDISGILMHMDNIEALLSVLG